MSDKVQTGQHEEYDAELYYGIHATNWLTLRPNIQYIRHVGGYKNGENVWVGGLKLQAAFNYMLILIKGFDEPCSILMKMLNSLKT